ncbi:hypothetical protein IV203_036603 [Nitzschia inconspicua]|uniref:Uncharacterized protein n=1 Tax=Nitzschia inconspicua TaxID=303405 RepID=A0A9K3LG81_9STRA|nr:hypothetical protein IV203_036603 [Nitzschia inconspicua]
MNVFPDRAEIVVDGGPIPVAAAAAIAPDGGGGAAAAAAVGGHLTLDSVCGMVDWLTEHGSDRLHAIQVRRAGETNRAFNIRIRTELHAVLRDANQNPVIHLDRIQPERFIEFILTLRRAGTNRYLSKSSYGNKRASLFHLFRLHNRVGLTSAFSTELSNLFRGFYRQMIQQRAPNRAANDEVAPPDGFPQRREGKEPMSVELYKAICEHRADQVQRYVLGHIFRRTHHFFQSFED